MKFPDSKKLILTAIETAPLYDPLSSPSIANLGQYETLEDHDIIVEPQWVPKPNLASVATLPQFKELLHVQADITGIPISRSFVNTVIRHEKEHAEAAKQLGAKEIVYSVEFHKKAYQDDPSNLYAYANRAVINYAGLCTTKLGRATTAAAPVVEGFGDLRSITDLGYVDFEDVALRAIQSNRTQGTKYPVPAKFRKPKTS